MKNGISLTPRNCARKALILALNDSVEVFVKGNGLMHIEIDVRDSLFVYRMNGQEVFRYIDIESLNKGYFGLRTFESHQIITNFRVE